MVGPLAIVNGTLVEVTPPETTLTLALLAVTIRPAGTSAVNCVGLTNVVFKAVPFHCTVDDAAKPTPLIVNVSCGPPAGARFGLIESIAGPADTAKGKLGEVRIGVISGGV